MQQHNTYVPISFAEATAVLAAQGKQHQPDTNAPRTISDPFWLIRGNPEHPEHDPLGMRNPGGLQIPELVIIGDGQVYGLGLPPDASWPGLLKANLGKGVINAGMPGWGGLQFAMAAETLAALSPRRVIVSLCPARALSRTFGAVTKSIAPLAKQMLEPGWANLPMPDESAVMSARRATSEMAAQHPELTDEDILTLLAQRGEPDVDPCVIESSRFYLAEHALYDAQDLDQPAIQAGLTALVRCLSHLRRLADERSFALSVLLEPTREYLVYQRLGEAILRDTEALERLGLAEASALGELRAACAGLGITCFDLTGHLKYFVGGRIHAQNSREGRFTRKGAEIMARFVRERVLTQNTFRTTLRVAAGGFYSMI